MSNGTRVFPGDDTTRDPSYDPSLVLVTDGNSSYCIYPSLHRCESKGSGLLSKVRSLLLEVYFVDLESYILSVCSSSLR